MEPDFSLIDHQHDDNGHEADFSPTAMLLCEEHSREDRVRDVYIEDKVGEVYSENGSGDHAGEISAVPINIVLPHDLLERVLAYLSIANVVKAGCVCKKWNEMVRSCRFRQKVSSAANQKPWYFMFTGPSEPHGHVYDPTLLKWYGFELPYVEAPDWSIASSSGLICSMDNDSNKRLYVCNPITKDARKLKDPLGIELSDYSSLAISFIKPSNCYMVAIVKSKQPPGEEIEWNISLHVYRSEHMNWEPPVRTTLQGWRGGSDSIICGGVLYFVVYMTRSLGWFHHRYGLIAHDLASQCFDFYVDDDLIPVPCLLTCIRLVNLDEKLVLVGGIQKQGRHGVIKGIGIWALKGRDWEEESRMPNKLFKGFGEFDEVFACSGFGEYIYIQSYGSTALLVFNIVTKQWKWSHKCPVVKKFHFQLFSGICFEPRLDIAP